MTGAGCRFTVHFSTSFSTTSSVSEPSVEIQNWISKIQQRWRVRNSLDLSCRHLRRHQHFQHSQKLCSVDQPSHSARAYAAPIAEMNANRQAPLQPQQHETVK